MSKIRIAVPGYEAFDGFLGTLEFKGGVSVREATDMEIRRIGANIRIETVDGSEQIGPSVNMVKNMGVSAKVEVALKRESEIVTETAEKEVKYTQEQLEEIADKGGIKAIRKIANEFGVKGVAINELITEILVAQKVD